MTTNANTAQINAVESKVPEITLLFWVLKIAATTLGETAGDAVSMSMHLGYLVGTAIFATIFLAAKSNSLRLTAPACRSCSATPI